jgi:hypothetical protein
MLWRRVVLLATSMLLSVSAYAVDWRVWGHDADQDELMLYSASDLVRDGNNVRVWTEVLSFKDVTSFDIKKHPEAMQKVYGRFKAGYRPEFAKLNNLDAQAAVNVALAEEVANELASPVRMRSLYEFDCAGGRARIVQASSFLPPPEQHLTEPLPWESISPDTQVASLKGWVCKKS